MVMSKVHSKILLNLSSGRDSAQGVTLKLWSLRWIDERGDKEEDGVGDANDKGNEKGTHACHSLSGFSLVLTTEPPTGAENAGTFFLIFCISLLGPQVVVFLGVGQLIIVIRERVMQRHLS